MVRDLNMSRSWVKTLRLELEKDGWFDIERPASKGGGRYKKVKRTFYVGVGPAVIQAYRIDEKRPLPIVHRGHIEKRPLPTRARASESLLVKLVGRE
jgi:hypothetical protein